MGSVCCRGEQPRRCSRAFAIAPDVKPTTATEHPTAAATKSDNTSPASHEVGADCFELPHLIDESRNNNNSNNNSRIAFTPLTSAESCTNEERDELEKFNVSVKKQLDSNATTAHAVETRSTPSAAAYEDDSMKKSGSRNSNAFIRSAKQSDDDDHDLTALRYLPIYAACAESHETSPASDVTLHPQLRASKASHGSDNNSSNSNNSSTAVVKDNNNSNANSLKQDGDDGGNSNNVEKRIQVPSIPLNSLYCAPPHGSADTSVVSFVGGSSMNLGRVPSTSAIDQQLSQSQGEK